MEVAAAHFAINISNVREEGTQMIEGDDINIGPSARSRFCAASKDGRCDFSLLGGFRNKGIFLAGIKSGNAAIAGLALQRHL